VSFALAFATVAREIGLDGMNGLIVTALLVGGAVVLLGGGWRTARRGLLKVLPTQGIAGRIFPPEPEPAGKIAPTPA
jgi:hypothetical protein